ncbi:MAG: SpoIIE family protein phosphatase, partial [Bacteroidota bacterium]
PLYLVRKGIGNSNLANNGNIKYFGEDLAEFKPDKQPIGYEEGKEGSFTKHEIQLQKGDTLYLLSDGYQDQFGGEKGKKFMTKRLKQLFIDINDKSMSEQKEILNSTVEDWKGSGEQVDDICIIGVQV